MTYVRVDLAAFDPTRHDDIQRHHAEHALPSVRQLPGLRRYTLGIDQTTGRGIVVSEWDTRKQADELPETYGTEAVQQLTELGVTWEGCYIYDVAAEI